MKRTKKTRKMKRTTKSNLPDSKGKTMRKRIEFRPYRRTGYKVSACGKVLGLRGRVLRPAATGSGHLGVDLQLVTGPKTVKVHSMVAEVWIGKRPKGQVVNHKDGIKAHNHVSNLEYVTPSANTEHALANSLQAHGGDRSFAALTNAQAYKVVKLIKAGHRNVDIAEEFKVKPYIVRDIKNGKAYRRAMENKGVKYPIA